MTKKYEVTLEFTTSGIDLLQHAVVASSKEEAIKLALIDYHTGKLDESNRYASNCYDSELNNNSIDWIVEEKT